MIRRGRRAGSATVVVHVVHRGGSSATGPARAGLVVSRAVGNAVTRNHVKRRLRHLLRERLPALPAGSMLVVRALPPAGAASSTELAADLDATLARLARGKEARA